ncbi:MAG: CPBP family intramembrane glutamic endopeptidase [Bacteroidota bacterium]
MNQNTGKTDLFSYLITLVITALSLVFSSGLIGTIYLSLSKKSSFETEDLISFFGKNVFFLLQLFPFLIALISLLFCVKFIHKQNIKVLFTQKLRFNFKHFLVSFLLWGGILFLIFLAQFFLFKKPIKWNFDFNHFWLLCIISFIFVSIQTLFEEVLFRGFLLQGFLISFPKKWMAILASSLLFALMHFNNPEIKIFGSWILVYYLITAIFLASITLLGKGIELAFGFHLVNNLFGTLILTNNWQVFQTDALFKDFSPPMISWDIWFSLFIFYPVLFFIYKKLYKWKIGEIFA